MKSLQIRYSLGIALTAAVMATACEQQSEDLATNAAPESATFEIAENAVLGSGVNFDGTARTKTG